jgi:hypothetical protein
MAVTLLGVIAAAAAVLVSILHGDPGEGPGLDEPDARSPSPETRDSRVELEAQPENGGAAARRPRAAAGDESASSAPITPDAAARPSKARESRVAASPPGLAAHSARAGGARASQHPDGGVAMGPDGGARSDAGPATAPWHAYVEERSESDEEAELRQVERFVSDGGATLEGRVIEADSGNPIAGAAVHVQHAGMFVEARTDATGAFRIPGMPPGSRLVVWVGRNGDPFVDERLAVNVPMQEADLKVDAGTVKLLRGDELASGLVAWVGLFVTRRRGQIVVSAVSPWQPADAAEIRVGDQVLAIDGRDVAGLGPRAVTYLLRGPAGSPVTLIVRTPDHDQRKLTLKRVRR